jgi:hypothetical protein
MHDWTNPESFTHPAILSYYQDDEVLEVVEVRSLKNQDRNTWDLDLEGTLL